MAMHALRSTNNIDTTCEMRCGMQASASAAKDVSGAAKGYLGYVLSHAQDSQILPLIENAVECRTELAPCLSGNRCPTVCTALPANVVSNILLCPAAYRTL